MSLVALGWRPNRSAEDEDEIGWVEAELHPHLVRDSVSCVCYCLSLRRRMKLGVPRPAGG